MTTNYTENEIAEMHRWANFNGFAGYVCHTCKAKVNILAGGPGWICDCGAYNTVDLLTFPAPHDVPDYGPSAATIAREFHS